MYTLQIVSDKTPCVDFIKGRIPIFFWWKLKVPDHTDWWGWDLNIGRGNHWVISMRENKGKERDYMLWNCYKSPNLNTAQIVLSNNQKIPLSYMFTWILLNIPVVPFLKNFWKS